MSIRHFIKHIPKGSDKWDDYFAAIPFELSSKGIVDSKNREELEKDVKSSFTIFSF